jgi:DNA-binding LacI/PurR family transcriptional regulator
MGAEAARMLIRMVDGWRPEASVLLDTEVVVRGTLGPAPGQPRKTA